MITFDQSAPDAELSATIGTYIESDLWAAQRLLPETPKDVTIHFDNRYVVDETGVGGFAAAPGSMVLAFDPEYPDRDAQLDFLRGAIFHKVFHFAQGHTSEAPSAQYDTALDMAIYEGAATVFEREYADSHPSWGDYSVVPDATLDRWEDELARTPVHLYVASTTSWREWSSGSPDPEQTWRSYRVGTRLVDRYLTLTGKDVLDIRSTPAHEVANAVRRPND